MFRTLLCGCYIHRGFYNAVTVYGCIWIDVFRMLLLYMLYMDRCLEHCYAAVIFIEVSIMLLLYMVVYG